MLMILTQIKNLVQVLISHPAFLEDGDSIEKLREDQKQEAIIVESDRSLDPEKGRMLFKGYFNDPPQSSIFDTSDGVYRCPFCNWELEGTHCGQCDRTFENDNDSHAALSFSGDENSLSEDTGSEPETYRPEDYAALAQELDDDVDIERMTSFADYSPGHATIYDPSEHDDNSSTSSEESQMRQLTRATLGEVERARAGLDRTDPPPGYVAWSESDTESEGYHGTSAHSMPHGPITWANHPNFARTDPNNESEDEYDTDIGGFIDDGSLIMDSVSASSTDEGNTADYDANEQDDEEDEEIEEDGDGDGLSAVSANGTYIPTQAPIRHREEDAESSGRSSISSQGASTLTDRTVKEEAEQGTPSSEAPKYMPLQQPRKRRRMVVIDDSDEEEEIYNTREARARARAPGPQASRQISTFVPSLHHCSPARRVLTPRRNLISTRIMDPIINTMETDEPLVPAALLPCYTSIRSLADGQTLAASNTPSASPPVRYPPIHWPSSERPLSLSHVRLPAVESPSLSP